MCVWCVVCASNSTNHHAWAPSVSVSVVSGGGAPLPSVCSLVTVQQWSYSLASESAQESGSLYVQTARVMCLVSVPHDCLSKLTLQQICWVYLVVWNSSMGFLPPCFRKKQLTAGWETFLFIPFLWGSVSHNLKIVYQILLHQSSIYNLRLLKKYDYRKYWELCVFVFGCVYI